jgi:hypothetical protein
MGDVEANVIYISSETALPALDERELKNGNTEPKLRIQCTKPYPSALAVNREARSIALKTHRCFARGIPLVLNPAKDLIFLQDINAIEAFNIVARQINSRFDLTTALVDVGICYLAIGIQPLDVPFDFCAKVASLKTLIIAQSESRGGPDATDESWEEIETRSSLSLLWACQRLSWALGELLTSTVALEKILQHSVTARGAMPKTTPNHLDPETTHTPDLAKRATALTTVKYLGAETMRSLAEGRVELSACND